MTNSLINISKVLADKSANTNLTSNLKLDGEVVKSLNYEIMFGLVIGEVEKLIILNKGNKTIDQFHKDILLKLNYAVSKLIPKTNYHVLGGH
jgi:hypothetical protein